MTKEKFLEIFNSHNLAFAAANRQEQVEVLQFLRDEGYYFTSYAAAALDGSNYNHGHPIGLGISIADHARITVDTFGGGQRLKSIFDDAVLTYKDFLDIKANSQISLNTEDFSLLWEDE